MASNAIASQEKSMLEELLENYDEGSAEDALSRHQAEAEALPEAELASMIPTDILFCLDAGLSLMDLVNDDKKALLGLPDIDEAMIQSLPTLRLALWQTSVLTLLTLPEETKRSLKEVVSSLRILRKRLYGAADFVWASDPAIQAKVEEIRKGKGYADLASDGLAFVSLFTEHMEEAQDWLKEDKLNELLDQAKKLAPILLQLRQEPGKETDMDKAQELHARIYTLYERTYDALAKAGRYLYEGKDAQRTSTYANLYTTYLRSARNKDQPNKTSPAPTENTEA